VELVERATKEYKLAPTKAAKALVVERYKKKLSPMEFKLLTSIFKPQYTTATYKKTTRFPDTKTDFTNTDEFESKIDECVYLLHNSRDDSILRRCMQNLYNSFIYYTFLKDKADKLANELQQQFIHTEPMKDIGISLSPIKLDFTSFEKFCEENEISESDKFIHIVHDKIIVPSVHDRRSKINSWKIGGRKSKKTKSKKHRKTRRK